MTDDPRSTEALKDVIKDWRKWAFFSYSVILDTDNPVIRFRNNRSELIAELDLRKLAKKDKITREAPGHKKGLTKNG